MAASFVSHHVFAESGRLAPPALISLLIDA
jgi:hypothetical protein